MWKSPLGLIILYFLHRVSGYDKKLCNDSQRITSCTEHIVGQNISEHDSCKLEFFPANSSECKKMNLNSLSSNSHVGGIILRPYLLEWKHQDDTTTYEDNYTILNITFTNIKWKTMRFSLLGTQRKNHCRKIVIANNVTINDKSILYYDCFWSLPSTLDNYTLHFEAMDGKVLHTGRYYFRMPSEETLRKTSKESQWSPFIYIEMLSEKLRLHVEPPPSNLNISSYKINMLMRCHINTFCREDVKSATLSANHSKETTFDFDYHSAGYSALYNFEVIPLHAECERDHTKCLTVQSPVVSINMPERHTICIVTVSALVVATVFALYLALRFCTRCIWPRARPPYRNYIPPPTKVLAVYPLTNRYHAKCVASFVNYLRTEFGFDITHYPDINNTTNRDPQKWAIEAFGNTSHFMYIVGPNSDSETKFYPDTYDDNYSHFDPLVFRNLDRILLSYLQQSRAVNTPKNVLNVYFDYSNGTLPPETFYDRKFYLLKDWHKLIDYLSKNLLPKKQIMRTENGKCFLDDLNSAKKLLGDCDRQNV